MGEAANMERMKVASLFAGCGGMDLGMLGGFDFLGQTYPKHPVEIVYAIDNDRYACEIYNRNFDLKCVVQDIREVDPAEIPRHDILTGGFPCTSFSIIAQNPPRLGYKDAKGQLFFEMVRILKEKQPSCFIAENVKGILSANKGKAFPLLIKTLEEASYHVTYALLDASDFGIPQKRQRIFIIGFRDHIRLESFAFPKPTTREDKVPLAKVIFSESEVAPKYYFSERAVWGMNKVRERINKGRVQDISGPCNTIGAHLAKFSLNSTDPVLKVNERYRSFTPREAARIQSFPENFRLVGSDTRQYRAIGNAVPPVLMWHITQSIIAAYRRPPIEVSMQPLRPTH